MSSNKLKIIFMKQNYLKSVLHYNQDTGIFTWINPPKQHPRLKGEMAGSNKTGYILIKINNKKYKAHRLAWLYMYGKFPENNIDHINGNALDNRIINLRTCDQAQNNANKRRYLTKKISKGVRKNKKSYSARIQFRGVCVTIGCYKTEKEASDAYFEKAKELYGEYARRD